MLISMIYLLVGIAVISTIIELMRRQGPYSIEKEIAFEFWLEK